MQRYIFFHSVAVFKKYFFARSSNRRLHLINYLFKFFNGRCNVWLDPNYQFDINVNYFLQSQKPEWLLKRQRERIVVTGVYQHSMLQNITTYQTLYVLTLQRGFSDND